MNCDIEIRRLSLDELKRHYLPLRLIAFAEELGWASSCEDSEATRDIYDKKAICFGAFWGDRMLGAIRLVLGHSTDQLPSGRHLPSKAQFEGKCGELNRAVVEKHFRGYDLYGALVLHATVEAIDIGARQIFGTIVDTPARRRLIVRLGYEVVGDPFNYEDDLLSIPLETVAVQLRKRFFGNTSEMKSRRTKMLQKTEQRIGGRLPCDI